MGGCSVALAGPVGSQPGHRIMSWPDSSYTTQLGCNSCNAPPLRLVPLLRFNVFQHSKSKPRHLVVCRKQVVTCCDCKHPNCTNHPKVWQNLQFSRILETDHWIFPPVGAIPLSRDESLSCDLRDPVGVIRDQTRSDQHENCQWPHQTESRNLWKISGKSLEIRLAV